jgi:hypothetical protein
MAHAASSLPATDTSSIASSMFRAANMEHSFKGGNGKNYERILCDTLKSMEDEDDVDF